MYFWPRSDSAATTTGSSSKHRQSTDYLPADPEKVTEHDLTIALPIPLKMPVRHHTHDLPPPVTASNSHAACNGSLTTVPRRSRSGTSRIQQGFKDNWARFKKRLGTASDEPSESGFNPGESGCTGGEGGSASFPRRRGPGTNRPMMDGPHDLDADLDVFGRHRDADVPPDEDDDERSVDEIVVDRVWYSHEHDRTTVTQSEHNHNNPDNVKAGSCHQHLHHHGAHQHRSGGDITNTDTDHDSLSPRAEGFWGLWLPLTILRYRAWPATLDFFSSRFYDEKAEDNYRKEIWFSGKVGFFDVIASGIGTDDHRVCFEMLVTGSLVLTVLYHQLGIGLRTRAETVCIGG